MTTTAEILQNGTRLEIPLTKGVPRSIQRLSLDGKAYSLELSWNMRANGWTFSLSDAEGSPIASDLKLVPNWPLLRYLKWDPRCPPGEMIAQDDGSGDDIGFDDIGGESPRVTLVYYAVEVT